MTGFDRLCQPSDPDFLACDPGVYITVAGNGYSSMPVQLYPWQPRALNKQSKYTAATPQDI